MSAVIGGATQQNAAGEIQLIFGPMFSGKSTELLRRVRRFKAARRRCLLVKYIADTRYSQSSVSTHDKVQCDALPCDHHLTASISPLLHEYDVIGIDEGQFFVDIVAFSQSVATMGKIVIVAACDSTFEGKPFGDVLNLVPCAEKVDKLSAICVYCQHDASFSARLSDETDLEVIGGDDKYAAVCRSCFNSRFNLPHSSP